MKLELRNPGVLFTGAAGCVLMTTTVQATAADDMDCNKDSSLANDSGCNMTHIGLDQSAHALEATMADLEAAKKARAAQEHALAYMRYREAERKQRKEYERTAKRVIDVDLEQGSKKARIVHVAAADTTGGTNHAGALEGLADAAGTLIVNLTDDDTPQGHDMDCVRDHDVSTEHDPPMIDLADPEQARAHVLRFVAAREAAREQRKRDERMETVSAEPDAAMAFAATKQCNSSEDDVGPSCRECDALVRRLRLSTRAEFIHGLVANSKGSSAHHTRSV